MFLTTASRIRKLPNIVKHMTITNEKAVTKSLAFEIKLFDNVEVFVEVPEDKRFF